MWAGTLTVTKEIKGNNVHSEGNNIKIVQLL